MYDDAYEQGYDPEGSEEITGTRVILKLEVIYDPLDEDHPSQWDYEDRVGPGTILLDYEDIDEDWDD